MKIRKTILGLGLFLFCVLGLVAWVASKKALPVLMYHRIVEGEATSKLEVSRGIFAMQMAYLKKEGFQVIGPSELVKMIQLGQRPGKQVVLTFDDGYEDNYTLVAPMLDQLGFKGTFFIVTDWVGKRGWMDWKQLRDLQKRGHTIGAHSVTHRFLTEIPLAEAKDEIYNSKRLIQEKLGQDVRIFCYPAGRFNTAVERLVQQAGYETAFTNAPGWAFSNRDVFALKRIRISDNYTLPWQFWWRVTGYSLFFRERSARRMTGWS